MATNIFLFAKVWTEHPSRKSSGLLADPRANSLPALVICIQLCGYSSAKGF